MDVNSPFLLLRFLCPLPPFLPLSCSPLLPSSSRAPSDLHAPLCFVFNGSDPTTSPPLLAFLSLFYMRSDRRPPSSQVFSEMLEEAQSFRGPCRSAWGSEARHNFLKDPSHSEKGRLPYTDTKRGCSLSVQGRRKQPKYHTCIASSLSVHRGWVHTMPMCHCSSPYTPRSKSLPNQSSHPLCTIFKILCSSSHSLLTKAQDPYELCSSPYALMFKCFVSQWSKYVLNQSWITVYQCSNPLYMNAQTRMYQCSNQSCNKFRSFVYQCSIHTIGMSKSFLQWCSI